MREAPQCVALLAQSRTVTVERMRRPDGIEVVRKIYLFPTRRDRLRGMLRGTWLGRNKARREFVGLRFLQGVGVPAIEALEWTVQRNRFGFVTECSLVTRAYTGHDLARVLREGRIPESEVWVAIGTSVRRMHDAGFWHRGLSARNLLLVEESCAIRWLDPAKSLTYPAGGLPEGARAHDLLRFWTPLLTLVPPSARQAFAKAYGSEECLDLDALWRRIPYWRLASTRREMQREQARFRGC